MCAMCTFEHQRELEKLGKKTRSNQEPVDWYGPTEVDLDRLHTRYDSKYEDEGESHRLPWGYSLVES